MDQLLFGPARAYRVRLQVWTLAEGRRDGLLAQTERGARREEAGPEALTYFIAEAGALSCTLELHPDGLGVQGLRLAAPGPVALLAAVTALPAAPEWLEAVGEYLLFEGDAAAVRPALYVPLRRRGGGETAPARVSLARLVHALGYSIARANARLAALPAPGGVGLAASLQVRVGVRALRLGPGEQVVIALARSDEKPEQFLDLTMSTAADTGDGEG